MVPEIGSSISEARPSSLVRGARSPPPVERKVVAIITSSAPLTPLGAPHPKSADCRHEPTRPLGSSPVVLPQKQRCKPSRARKLDTKARAIPAPSRRTSAAGELGIRGDPSYTRGHVPAPVGAARRGFAGGQPRSLPGLRAHTADR